METPLIPAGAVVGASEGSFSVTTVTSNYSVTDNDDAILADCASGPIAITLHAAATAKRKIYQFKKIDATSNAMTIEGLGVETIDGDDEVSTSVQFTNYSLIPNNAGWNIV